MYVCQQLRNVRAQGGVLCALARSACRQGSAALAFLGGVSVPSTSNRAMVCGPSLVMAPAKRTQSKLLAARLLSRHSATVALPGSNTADVCLSVTVTVV
jgi:hypothetical protein